MMQYVLQAPNVWHGFLTLNNANSNFPGAYGEAGFVAAQGGTLRVGTVADRERSVGEGRGPKDEDVERHLFNEATIREMSTMAFA